MNIIHYHSMNRTMNLDFTVYVADFMHLLLLSHFKL